MIDTLRNMILRCRRNATVAARRRQWERAVNKALSDTDDVTRKAMKELFMGLFDDGIKDNMKESCNR